MDKGKAGKALTLLLGVAAVALSFIDVDYTAVGLYRGCTLMGRFLYPFVHAGVLHAALNSWCLVGLAFIYGITPSRMAVAYLAAVSVPAFLLSATPTVGLSGAVFFLFGSLSFKVKRRLYWQGWMAFYLLTGLLLPGVAGLLHLYCYTLGVAWAFLDKPYVKKR